MACKITHRVNDQQIRFANRDAAERYAEIMGGGADNWVFTTVTPRDAAPAASPLVTADTRPARHAAAVPGNSAFGSAAVTRPARRC